MSRKTVSAALMSCAPGLAESYERVSPPGNFISARTASIVRRTGSEPSTWSRVPTVDWIVQASADWVSTSMPPICRTWRLLVVIRYLACDPATNFCSNLTWAEATDAQAIRATVEDAIRRNMVELRGGPRGDTVPCAMRRREGILD